MKSGTGSGAFWLAAVALAGLGMIGLAVWMRRPPAPTPSGPAGSRAADVPSPTSVAPAPSGFPGQGRPAPEAPTAPVAAAARPALPADPVLRQWQVSIREHNAKAVLGAQSTFLSREREYREPLIQMAKEDPEPRIRAFSVAVLGRMSSPPAESFFVDRLADPQDFPRISALDALGRLGTRACLDTLDRLASSDPGPTVREAALRAAKAVRSR